jgi:hypothetical protein
MASQSAASTRQDLTPPDGLGYQIEAGDHDCPECKNLGRLFGYIELEDQVDLA